MYMLHICRDQQPYLPFSNHVPQQGVGFQGIQNELTILASKQTSLPIFLKNNEGRRSLEAEKFEKSLEPTSSECLTSNHQKKIITKHQQYRKGSFFDIQVPQQTVSLSHNSQLAMIKANTEKFTNGFYKNLLRNSSKDNKSQSLSLASSPGVTSAQRSVCSTQTNFEWMNFEKQDKIQQEVTSTPSKPTEIERKQLLYNILEEDKRNRIKQEQMDKGQEQKKVSKVFSNKSLRRHDSNSFHDSQLTNPNGRYNFKTTSKSSHQLFSEALQRRLSTNQQSLGSQIPSIYSHAQFYNNQQFPVFPKNQGISLNHVRSQGMLVILAKEQEKMKKINSNNNAGLVSSIQNKPEKYQHNSTFSSVIQTASFKKQRQIRKSLIANSTNFYTKNNSNFQTQIINRQSKLVVSEKQKEQQESIKMAEVAVTLEGTENSKEQENAKE